MLDEQDFQKIGSLVRAIVREEMMVFSEEIIMPQSERIDARLDVIEHRFDRMRISW